MKEAYSLPLTVVSHPVKSPVKFSAHMDPAEIQGCFLGFIKGQQVG